MQVRRFDQRGINRYPDRQRIIHRSSPVRTGRKDPQIFQSYNEIMTGPWVWLNWVEILLGEQGLVATSSPTMVKGQPAWKTIGAARDR